MTKYAPLTSHLAAAEAGELHMEFAEIERIIGHKLPPSAHRHAAWWGNNPTGHSQAKAWLQPGWQVTSVDLQRKSVVFGRNRGQSGQIRPAGFAEDQPPPFDPAAFPAQETTLTIPSVDPITLSRLKAKAELAGRTVEEVARDILDRGAVLTPQERLAIADRIRAMTPPGPPIDVVALIREDRDTR